jgi:proteasome lid subunit RPN8/RPN11
MNNKPTIYIYPSIWDKILTYSRLTYEKYKTEVGGMSPVIRHGDKWIITDAHILKQETTGTETQLDKQELANYMAKVSSDNIKMVEDNSLMFLWWHTHPNFGATMSGTDWSTINDYSKNGDGMALVVNNDGEYELILSIKSPFKLDLNCELKKYYETESFEDLDKEIDTLVTATRYSYTPRNFNHFNGSQTSFFHDEEKVTEKKEEKYTNNEMVDIATYQLDNALDDYANGNMTDDDIIDFIKQMNGNCLEYEFSFRVPKKQDIKHITNAYELIEGVEGYATV